MSYLSIQDPKSHEVYNIHSPEAKTILKRYLVALQQEGGLFEKKVHKVVNITIFDTQQPSDQESKVARYSDFYVEMRDVVDSPIKSDLRRDHTTNVQFPKKSFKLGIYTNGRFT